MFRFQPGRTYQMPVHFGPCCGPRSGPLGERFFADGPQTSIQHSLVYETSPQLLENYLPEGFSLRSPHVIVTHKMHRDLPWLAGRGYNVVTFNTPVTYQGKEETTVEKTWYADAQEWAVKMGIADGTRPLDTCTRAEMWTMLQRLYNLIKGGK